MGIPRDPYFHSKMGTLIPEMGFSIWLPHDIVVAPLKVGFPGLQLCMDGRCITALWAVGYPALQSNIVQLQNLLPSNGVYSATLC